MMRIDGFLSRKAQEADPTALVYVLEYSASEVHSRKTKVNQQSAEQKSKQYILKYNHNTEEVGLGDSFKFANQGVEAWVKSKQKTKEKNHE